MLLAELEKLLERHALGQAWLLNLKFALRYKHCTRQMATNLLERACAAIDASVTAGHVIDEAAAWQSVSFAMSTTVIRPERESLPLDQKAELTHVTTLANMESYHYDGLTEALSESTAYRPGTDATTRFHIVKDMLDELITAGSMQLRANATLGLQRLWVTPESNSLMSKRLPEQAGDVRDERGLIHLGTEHFLVAYAFKVAVAPPIYRPTALDAVGTRFRPWSNLPRRHEPLGTAVNLARFAAGEVDIDGVAEGLVPGFPLTKNLIHRVILLGSPKRVQRHTHRGLARDGSDGHEAFALRLVEEVRNLGLSPSTSLHEQLETKP